MLSFTHVIYIFIHFRHHIKINATIYWGQYPLKSSFLLLFIKEHRRIKVSAESTNFGMTWRMQLFALVTSLSFKKRLSHKFRIFTNFIFCIEFTYTSANWSGSSSYIFLAAWSALEVMNISIKFVFEVLL